MLVLSLFFAGCATQENTSSMLYKEYSLYERDAKKDNIIETASNIFSRSLLGNDYRTSPDSANQLLLKNYMAAKDSHYEKINSQEGCLVINGYDESGAPLILSIKYILIDSRWLIDDIHIAFIESQKNFSRSAKCPAEYSQ